MTERAALVESLEKAGVRKSDILMVHSNVSRLLKLPLQTNERLRFFLDALLDAVSDGMLIVPTFSYRFCDGAPFDMARTPSEVGLFTEFVRRDPRALRSTHPIFSVAAIGADAPFLCRHLSNASYGAGSIFERLYASDAKLLHFDVPLADACTFAHFPEQSVGVPYRYSKHFRGVSVIEGESTVGDWEFYVRATERWDFLPQPANELRYPKDLVAKGHSVFGTWKDLPLTVTPCRGIFDVISAGVRADPYYMLAGPPRLKRPSASTTQ